jgi:hypothetical protein
MSEANFDKQGTDLTSIYIVIGRGDFISKNPSTAAGSYVNAGMGGYGGGTAMN